MWQEEAKKLYFIDHKKIIEIAELLGKTRKTISTFLSKQEGFQEEKARRKIKNREKRKEYKIDWEKRKKQERSFIEASSLKRQHEIDVRVLSADKY